MKTIIFFLSGLLISSASMAKENLQTNYDRLANQFEFQTGLILIENTYRELPERIEHVEHLLKVAEKINNDFRCAKSIFLFPANKPHGITMEGVLTISMAYPVEQISEYINSLPSKSEFDETVSRIDRETEGIRERMGITGISVPDYLNLNEAIQALELLKQFDNPIGKELIASRNVITIRFNDGRNLLGQRLSLLLSLNLNTVNQEGQRAKGGNFLELNVPYDSKLKSIVYLLLKE